MGGSTNDLEETVEQVRKWIDEAQRIVVLTGAGISTDSGWGGACGRDGGACGSDRGACGAAWGGALSMLRLDSGQGGQASHGLRAHATPSTIITLDTIARVMHDTITVASCSLFIFCGMSSEKVLYTRR